MTDLSGKTALIIGSVQGIGLSVAEVLAHAGARIAVHGRAGDAQIEQACTHLRKAGSPQAEYFNANLRNADRIAELMAAVEAWGGADILVTTSDDPSIVDSPASWDITLAITLSAAFHTAHAALPLMARRGYGRMITIAPDPRRAAPADRVAYMAAQHGLIGLSRAMALDYGAAGDRAKGGIGVHCIAPGFGAVDGADMSAADIAALVLWLCDPTTHEPEGRIIPGDGVAPSLFPKYPGRRA